ncbi:MAG: protein kinase [Polyangiaceae bacterium]
MDIEPGTVVANRYRISRAIGRGGMGEVFAAENIRTGRPVAVKLLRADSKSKQSAVERFRREARAAGSINSDHVTQVLDVEDDTEHGIVIVFELLEGESLIDRLKRTGPIPFDELHPIIEEVWVGLSDAHKVGIIHRDLKPSNVFLERRPDGHQRVKILDFGISKLPKEMGGETLTEMGQSLGTFSFMPPEQIGRAKTVDHRADIYATTTMIYQSLTGQLPYVARNILVMVELKSKTNPRPLSEALGHPVDPSLEDFVAKGLARNPADRFQNALDALEKWRALKSLRVPESRRATSMSDPNLRRLAQQLNAQGAAQAPAPLPAAGRAPTGNFAPQVASQRDRDRPPATVREPNVSSRNPGAQAPSARDLQGPGSQWRGTGMSPPALVVPAGTLEPVRPGALPRLDDPTETTTDHSHIDLVNPKLSGANEPTPSGVAQRGQELRSTPTREPESSTERKGPQGTRVLPPSVVQQAVAVAEARKASQGDLRNVSSQAQGQVMHAPHSHGAHPSPAHGTHALSQEMPLHPPGHSQSVPVLQHPISVDRRQTTPSAQPSGRSTAAPVSPHGHPPSSAHVHGPQGPYAANANKAPSVPPPPSSAIAHPTPASGMATPHSSSPPGHPSSPNLHPSSPPPTTSPSQSGHLAQVPTPFPGVAAAQGNFTQQPGSQPSMGLAPIRQNGPVQLSTMRLPDESSSIPASQDKTTVYRPKERKPEKKQSVAVFVLGALAFAVVGFGIVFVVQWLVHRFAH